MYTTQDLRGLSVKDIGKERDTVMQELFVHRAKVRLGQEPTHDTISRQRRYIARIQTILNEKKRAAVIDAVK